MSPSKRYATKHANASRRRRHTAQERLARDRRHAQRAAAALRQAGQALVLPTDLVAESAGRVRRHHTLLGKIRGVLSGTSSAYRMIS